jgi:tyrosinase
VYSPADQENPMAEIVTRQNVWDLEDDWAEPILWYARGVRAMKARPLDDPLSWRFYGAIHGADRGLWQFFGYLGPNDTWPDLAVRNTYWAQCQHGSWFFLPWHRGYLRAFEDTVRAAVVAEGGPADWALPYWNYFKSGQNELPRAFASATWPDGQDDNPLFVEQRYGPDALGPVFVDLAQVDLNAMSEPAFTGVATGGSTGFGGVSTGFEHSGTPHGALEDQPHDPVHGLVGGVGEDEDGTIRFGLMSTPDSAGLDPIFWLHHANIDRLWEVWRRHPATHTDPTSRRWVDELFERAFVMPVPAPSGQGSEAWTYTAGEMSDLGTLGYTYDDLDNAGDAPPAAPRRRTELAGPATPAARETPAGGSRDVELIGANSGALTVGNDGVDTDVRLDPAARDTVRASLEATDAASDRVFVNLENIRSTVDGIVLAVYVDAPGQADGGHPERLAGHVALFGVRKASLIDGEMAGNGVTKVLEITSVVDDMHLDATFDVASLLVRIVPTGRIPDRAEVTVGRVSIYRQGG